MSGPLAGIRVVDLSVNVLGPLATQVLGDMGADVIKVETARGDPMRQSGQARSANMAAMFMNLNRNKRSMVLDLKKPPALEALMRLVETADVFVHSFRPGAAERLGISYPAIRKRNGRIIYACAPGYSPDGKYRDRPAFDDVIQGESGIAGMLGRVVGVPRYIPMVIADKFCAHVLASSIGMALFQRERSGAGQEVTVPMFETMLSFNLAEHLWVDFDEAGKRSLGYSRMFSDHRRPHATKDGYICLLAVNDEQWARLLQVIGRADLVDDERFAKLAQRTRHIDELYAIVGAQMPRKSTSEWHALLDAADIPNGAVVEFKDMASDPYLEATGFFHRYEHPTEGPMITTSIPVRFSATPGSIRLPPPGLGEHTRAILRDLGYDDVEVARIVDTSAAGGS